MYILHDVSGVNILSSSLPSAQPDFQPQVEEYLKDKGHVALLLDFDGTLSPLVSQPELASLPKETRVLLQRLAGYKEVLLALVSGRGVHNLRDKVGIQGIIYAGNHGLNIINADQSKVFII